MDICPQCGYSEKPKQDPQMRVMNEYVQKDNPKRIIVAPHIEDEFVGVTGEVGKEVNTTWVKKSVWDEKYKAEYAKSQLKAAKEVFTISPANQTTNNPEPVKAPTKAP